ncbi:hypothetical protein EV132_13051 [Rhizobium sullae]|uniref:Uncharacterized protein n=2 Tax=Rhizobium sullae TaxID=50338 RepID=A0A4R3PRQ0_RHISU|nr:hypothetical protein EV132_13051 [Rhizobium sullae]
MCAESGLTEIAAIRLDAIARLSMSRRNALAVTELFGVAFVVFKHEELGNVPDF